jgi:type II secretory pathway pseudopilin PulG
MRMRNSPLSSTSAFTLIELAIAVVLAGLIAGVMLSTKNAADTNDCYVQTKARLETVRGAIERYTQSNDRFPMPARRNVGVEDPSYGREINGSVPAEVAELDSVGGAIFGALPFATLSIPVENAMDCWGNKFTYAVTIDLTDTIKFRTPTTAGALTIKSTPANVFLAGAGYAIISHGADEVGAAKANYSHATDKKWCTPDATFKTENCNPADTDLAAAVFNNGEDAGASYFDDLIVYRGKPWRIGNSGSNAYFWGNTNGKGQYGIGTLGAQTSPFTAVSGGITFTQIAAGGLHSCGVTATGQAYCWGDGTYGQVPQSGYSHPDNKFPILIDTSAFAGDKRFDTISAGMHSTCGLTKDGWAYCWGAGLSGQRGDNSWSASSATVAFVSAGPFTAISVGSRHACALNSGGQALCWGNNARGEIGNGLHSGNPLGGPVGNPATPTPVSGGLTFKQIAASNSATCALNSGGQAYCWGMGAWNIHNGGTGSDPNCFVDGGAMLCDVPKPVSGGLTFKQLVASATSTNFCALTKTGTTYCWTQSNTAPVLKDVSALPAGEQKFVQITGGGALTCGLSVTGKVYCWTLVAPTPTLVSDIPDPANYINGVGGHVGAITGSLPKVDAYCGTTDSACIFGTFDPATRVDGGCGNNIAWTCRGIDGGSDDTTCSVLSPCGPPPPPPPPPLCNCSAGGIYVTVGCTAIPQSYSGSGPCNGPAGSTGTYYNGNDSIFDTGACPGQWENRAWFFTWSCS